MSELLIVEDDPDPLPAGETDLSTKIDDLDVPPVLVASETLLAERELALYERDAVTRLSFLANRILSTYETTGENDDCRVISGDVMLRRRIFERNETGYGVPSTVYFYVDDTDGQNYCRSWSAQGDQVNWCYQEQRHEPADDVMVQLEQNFPITRERATAERRFAARVLAKLRRS